jgi:hypothetical protein
MNQAPGREMSIQMAAGEHNHLDSYLAHAADAGLLLGRRECI